MDQSIQISKEEFENLETNHFSPVPFVPLKLVVIDQDDLEVFLNNEYEKLAEERHSCLGIPLKLIYKDKFILRYSSMSRFFHSSLNDAIAKKKFADIREYSPIQEQIFPWVGKNPSDEEIKAYYINKFSILPDQITRWGVIYISNTNQ